MSEFDKFPYVETGVNRRTVREYDGRLEEGSSEPTIVTNEGVEYPTIDIDKRPIIKPIKSSFRAKDYFVDEPTGEWKKCYQLWSNEGTVSALSYITTLPSSDEPTLQKIGRTIAKSLAHTLLYFYKLFLQIYLYYFPYAKHSDDTLCDEFCHYLGEKDLFVTFAWHPKKMVCAIGLSNNDIYIYSSLRKTSLLIKHPHQKKLSHLAWKPDSSNTLAVACQSCILVWDLDQVEMKTQLTNCVHLFKNGLPNAITSIAFDKTGEMLAICSPQSTKLFVLKKGLEGNDELHAIRSFPTCFTRLIWSPDSLRLLTLTTSNYIKIFESIAWSNKKWSLPNRSPIQCACWSQPDGTFLLLANKKDPIIYALAFYDQATANDVGGYVKQCQEVLDVSETTLPNGVKVGGRIHDMIWDSNGQRLVISFKDNPEYLAVYKTWSKSLLEITPIGFIHGFQGEKPTLISFHDHYKHGSLLTICWSSGVVSNIPLQYDSVKPTQSVIKNGTPRRLTSFCLSTPTSARSVNLNSSSFSRHSIASPRESTLFTRLQSSPRTPGRVS